jgi:hypothetical protein
MRYFVPQLAAVPEVYRRAGWTYSGRGAVKQLPDQFSLEGKFGGLPWGLPAERWPYCAFCHSPQSLIAQLRHERDRLDLGKTGRVLFVFQCNGDQGRCPTWDMNSGANSCFVLDEEELTEGLSEPNWYVAPEDHVDRWLDENVFEEWRVLRWQEKEDGIPASYPGFFGLLHALPEGYDEAQDTKFCSEVFQGTKLGSVPFWLQFPKDPPGGRFLGQIDSDCCQAFARGGKGYIFLTGPATAPHGWFLWQCT